MFSKSFAFFVAASLAVVAVNAQIAADSPQCARNYTVQLGDTCNSISAKQGVSTYQLGTVNQGIIDSACTNLRYLQPICLASVAEDCKPVHVVVPGDGCLAIIKAAGIANLTTLIANNPNVDAQCTNIYPEQVLCVSPVKVVGVAPPPPVATPTPSPPATTPPAATPAPPTTTPAVVVSGDAPASTAVPTTTPAVPAA